MTRWSMLLALCLSLPLAAHAEEKEKKKPKPAKPFRAADFAVYSGQALNKGTVALTSSIGYPFFEAGVLYGIGGFANVGANFRSLWGLTVGGDAHVMASLYKTKRQALAFKVEGGFSTLGAGDPNVLAFGPGGAGVGDGSRNGLPHAFSATTNATVTPQIVWSFKDTVGTWFLTGGATVQQFLDQPLDLPADRAASAALMPRLSVGLEQMMGGQISFHMEALGGVYMDPNDPSVGPGETTLSPIVMAQIGLNLYIP
jgi:hypothetical protein